MANVLIVDDDESDRILMRAMLRERGHELFFASNGEEAMKLYLRHRIHVVVSDIQMPRGDGIELIAALKGMDPDAAVVAVSGEAAEKLEKAREAGARCTLAKPFEPEALVAAVEEAAGAA